MFNMFEATKSPPHRPSTIESLMNIVELGCGVGTWLNDSPDDIDDWRLVFELTDHVEKIMFRVLVKIKDTPGGVTTLGIIQSKPI